MPIPQKQLVIGIYQNSSNWSRLIGTHHLAKYRVSGIVRDRHGFCAQVDEGRMRAADHAFIPLQVCAGLYVFRRMAMMYPWDGRVGDVPDTWQNTCIR